MARLDGSHRYVVITGDMQKPLTIVVDPVAGMLFWVDGGRNPRIETARLDGSNRRVLVNESISHVNDLALDYEVGIKIKSQHIKQIWPKIVLILFTELLAIL